MCVFFDKGCVILNVVLAFLSCPNGSLLACRSIQSCLKHLELVSLGTVCVANLTLYCCPLTIAVPKLRIVLDDGADVTNGSVVVAVLAQSFSLINRLVVLFV